MRSFLWRRYTGNALDEKTPLLRALDAINREGMRFVKNLGFKGAADASMATAYLGWEQEFFVISAEMYAKRPDLQACGRTVFGALPARGQQADLNYFGPVRVPRTVTPRAGVVVSLIITTQCGRRRHGLCPCRHSVGP